MAADSTWDTEPAPWSEMFVGLVDDLLDFFN